MKIRYDFVTNSSSTSYTIYLNQKIATYTKIKCFVESIFNYIQETNNPDLIIFVRDNPKIFDELETYLTSLSNNLDSNNKLDNWIIDEGSGWDWECSVSNFLDYLDNLRKLPDEWLRVKLRYD